MALTEAKKKANRKWDAENYERLNLMVPKGMNEQIEQAAKVQGYRSKRAFCIDALVEKINNQRGKE